MKKPSRKRKRNSTRPKQQATNLGILRAQYEHAIACT
jgi:hypothetical protein